MTDVAVDPNETRQAWAAAHLKPLWEQPMAHGGSAIKRERAHLWSWAQTHPLVVAATQLRGMEITERRVLTMMNPNPNPNGAPGAITNITAAYQILLPGESARPHRHSMNALRFVLDGSGAITRVDGKPCPMAEGDLILTPGWTWHEHTHEGTEPIVWLDVLDAQLHRFLGTDAFEPGPVHDVPARVPDAAFATANVVPVVGEDATQSPLFRYPWSAAAAALAAAPVDRDGVRRVRYVNPVNGGASMTLIDSTAIQLDPKTASVPFKTSSHAVCAVVEGTGRTTAGDDAFSWGPKDVFVLPSGAWVQHVNDAATPARIFVASDREVLRRLGLLEEKLQAG